jgi:hypothetical protein
MVASFVQYDTQHICAGLEQVIPCLGNNGATHPLGFDDYYDTVECTGHGKTIAWRLARGQVHDDHVKLAFEKIEQLSKSITAEYGFAAGGGGARAKEESPSRCSGDNGVGQLRLARQHIIESRLFGTFPLARPACPVTIRLN